MREVIDDLNEDEQIELVALSWVGRGDFLAEEWDDALTAARDRHTGPTSTYLLGMPLLGDLLEEGFTAVGHSCEDYEVPLSPPAPSPRLAPPCLRPPTLRLLGGGGSHRFHP